MGAFLRVMNALENIRVSIDLLEKSLGRRPTAGEDRDELLQRAVSETKDSIRVLQGGGLHPEAVAHLKKTKRLIKKAARGFFFKSQRIRKAIEQQEKARAFLIESAG